MLNLDNAEEWVRLNTKIENTMQIFLQIIHHGYTIHEFKTSRKVDG